VETKSVRNKPHLRDYFNKQLENLPNDAHISRQQ